MQEQKTPIAVGADENGAELKDAMRDYLHEKGVEVKDYGNGDSVDYPDVAKDVAEAVARGEHDRAILVCGTGIGMAITANKVPGVRAAQVADTYGAERARASNDAQIMALGGKTIQPEVAKGLVDHWLESEFQGGRSAPKVDKIKQIEADQQRSTGG